MRWPKRLSVWGLALLCGCGSAQPPEAMFAPWRGVRAQALDPQDSATASALMVVNRLQAWAKRPPIDRAALLASDPSGQWGRADAPAARLEPLSLHLLKALSALGQRRLAIDVVRVGAPHAADALQHVLARQATADGPMLLLAHLAHVAPGGAAADPGHFVVLAGADAKRTHVWILDPDPRRPAPYRLSLSQLMAAMQAIEPETGTPRGYLVVRLQS